MGGKENNLLCLLRDFKIRGAGGEGDVLCELMFISASRSRYPLNTRNGIRAVDRNSDLLIDEYAKKAREVNWEYGGTPMPPLQPRGTPAPPRVKGWCFGAWGDASQYVHELVQQVASARLEIADYEADIFGPPKSIAAQLAGLVGNIKRRLSITAVRLDCSSTASNFLGQGAVGTGQ